MRCKSLFCLLILIASSALVLQAQNSNSELVQISPPTIRRTEPPSATATVDELEKRGDELPPGKRLSGRSRLLSGSSRQGPE